MGMSTPDEAEPEAGPEAEPAAGPAEEPAAEPVERPAAEPGLPAAESTAKPVAEPAAGSTEEPAVEPKLAAYFAGDGFPDEETQRALRAWAIGELTDESTAEYVDALAALRGSEAAPEARAAFVARVAVLGAPDDHAAKFVAHVQGLPDAAAFVGTAAAVGDDGTKAKKRKKKKKSGSKRK